MTAKPRKVVIATPTITKPHPAYVASLEATASALEAAGWDLGVTLEIGCPYISAARAKMLRKALDAKADVVAFIDHDIEWSPTDILKLIETPGDVVAGLYRFKIPEVTYMGVLETTDDGAPIVRADGCLRANRIPAGFLKITPECVDRFMRAYPELVYGPAFSPGIDLFNHGAIDGIMWGEDYAFSNRWRGCGGDIWVVPNLNLTHHSADESFPGNFHEFLQPLPGRFDAAGLPISAA